MDEYKTTLKKLKDFDQEHLLNHYDDLAPKEQAKLLSEINKLDFHYLKEIREESLLQSHQNGKDLLMEPIPVEQFGSVSRSSESDMQSWEAEGLKSISEGKVAVLLLAGGQGTRLGVSYPKGMFDVGLPSHKTLYQIKAERIIRLQNMACMRYGKNGVIPWYIMTSDATKKQTKDFFQEHKYFGLDENQVKFFEQFTLPCLDFDGKVILADKHKLAVAPDGNGGLYKALAHWQILDDMEKRGIECTHVHCVDNILIRIADPRFIGFCRQRKADCGAKVVEKSSWDEAVGVVCKVQGVYKVVEYSEVSKDTASKQDKNGRLVFNAGNICNHYFTTEFLKKVCSQSKLVHHVAKKKIPFVNENGVVIKPSIPNGIKMEKFVFDVFQFSRQFVVFDVPREDEFSPLKNADGASSATPLHSRWALASLHHRRIIEAGGKIVDENGDIIQAVECTNDKCNEYPVQCEISPLLSYDGEDLQSICSGKSFKTPVILSEKIKRPNGC